MRKLFLIPLLAVLGASLLFLSPKTHAGGGDWDTSLSPSASSATANGSSTITFSVYAYYYTCSGRDSNGYLVTSTDPNYCANNGYGTATQTGQDISGSLIKVTGSGNTLSATTLTTDSSGHGSFTLESTVAESKTVSVTTPPGSVLASVNIAFTAPVSPTPATHTSTPNTSAAPASPTTTPQAPSAPAVNAVTISGAKADTSKPISLESGNPLVLSGKTVPNGIVTLTIHSTPKTVTTTADKDGNWSYSVSGLAPGSHYIDASVKDPATGQSSAPAQLLAFTVKAAPIASTVSKPVAKKDSKTALILGVVILLLMAGAGWYYCTRIRKPKQAPTQTPSIKV